MVADPAPNLFDRYVTYINFVSKASLGCQLDLKKIARRAHNAEYEGTHVTMRIRKPRTTARIYPSGTIFCTGANSEEESRIATRKYTRIIQKLGFPAEFLNFEIVNIVGCCNVNFPIRLGALDLVYREFCIYEPELEPELFYRMAQPSIIISISRSGRVVFPNAIVLQDLYDAFNYIYPILNRFKIQ